MTEIANIMASPWPIRRTFSGRRWMIVPWGVISATGPIQNVGQTVTGIAFTVQLLLQGPTGTAPSQILINQIKDFLQQNTQIISQTTSPATMAISVSNQSMLTMLLATPLTAFGTTVAGARFATNPSIWADFSNQLLLGPQPVTMPLNEALAGISGIV